MFANLLRSALLQLLHIVDTFALLERATDAFGILKSVSTKSNQDDEIGAFCKFLENKLRSYGHRTKNLLQQRLCDNVFEADAGYFSNNERYGYYTSQSHNYYTSRSETATQNPIYSSAHSSPTASTSQAATNGDDMFAQRSQEDCGACMFLWRCAYRLHQSGCRSVERK
ncbi:hypothetical protein K1T71_000128 [Dendrolimus kikuchii]|uniref:Uncharacterized protein n=1 Tax=Dendrolimus kikuchii TaxID=765133 RepID=A0ACC1DIH6_9NEOP|nr:hypothetical protein K1T71_000128 [Dendrolimus kikuchii]